MNRRQFLATSAVTGSGLIILPSGSLRGADAPSKKLNVALIGVWGRGNAHHRAIGKENVVALCDIDENKLAGAAKKWPKAKTFVDWRKLLDDHKALGLDAIVICTTDHTHAHITNWALNRDLHVYCEKPLANSVEEARTVRATYLKKRNKLASQVGTQRHAMQNFNRVRELVQDGAIGDLKTVYAWGNRQIPKPGYHPAKGEPPAHLHYDLWIGPSPMHPYNPEYFAGGPGANCLKWNMYWDFGGGQIGDMGSHTMDLAWWPLDADVASSAEAEGEKFNPEVSPVKMHSSFDIPANDWRGDIRLHWYQGGAMPKSPKSYVDLNRIGHGAMFKGTQGYIVSDFGSRLVLPFGDGADFTYYKPRTKETLIKPLGGFQDEWFNACKGDPTATTCNFDYGSKLIETMLLGLVAFRIGKKFKYDAKTGKAIGCPEADADTLMKRKYREGWPLNG